VFREIANVTIVDRIKTQRIKWLLVGGAPLLACGAIYIVGWRLMIPSDASNPETMGFSSPVFIEATFGTTVAALFPPFVLFISTVFGTLANILWSHAERPRDRLGWKSFAPLVVSPLTFFAVYSIGTSQPDGLAACLLAFQNGFFWQTIIGGRVPTKAEHG
jgi:hypothetical protein